ncbi:MULTISPECIES: VOC family protein [unclassified Beijerinckia]|uniref:VOC family protein n=1 Tax=unclassified Beijerinckia TaxID=2638183 RepID=UPI000898B7B6|nr:MULTISPECIES: VOC family protein [unclassified Beijerinckia]MDH7796722.1 PhnB protein [Beijerinckia sp. GAS462]SEC57191.1 PhnB protein [Beijerinckia sp. 28-YEA-48]
MAIDPVPEDYSGGIPGLCVDKGAQAVEVYKQAFGAVVTMRFDEQDGRLGHAEFLIGKARFSVSDEFPEYGVVSPKTLGGSPVSLHVYVPDVDQVAERAVAAGMKLLRPISNEFYGDRVARLQDPFGHRWIVASRIENLSLEDMYRRVGKSDG